MTDTPGSKRYAKHHKKELITEVVKEPAGSIAKLRAAVTFNHNFIPMYAADVAAMRSDVMDMKDDPDEEGNESDLGDYIVNWQPKRESRPEVKVTTDPRETREEHEIACEKAMKHMQEVGAMYDKDPEELKRTIRERFLLRVDGRKVSPELALFATYILELTAREACIHLYSAFFHSEAYAIACHNWARAKNHRALINARGAHIMKTMFPLFVHEGAFIKQNEQILDAEEDIQGGGSEEAFKLQLPFRLSKTKKHSKRNLMIPFSGGGCIEVINGVCDVTGVENAFIRLESQVMDHEETIRILREKIQGLERGSQYQRPYNQGQQERKPPTCYNCGVVGHISKYCNAPRQQYNGQGRGMRGAGGEDPSGLVLEQHEKEQGEE